MSSPVPVQVKQVNLNELSLTWSDGHKSLLTMRTLRDRCPCAGCNGETVLFQTYVPEKPDTGAPGRYVLKGVERIGGYALKFAWGDGHDMGLYTWEHLRGLCQCIECTAHRG
jgi:DUF971 family protein